MKREKKLACIIKPVTRTTPFAEFVIARRESFVIALNTFAKLVSLSKNARKLSIRRINAARSANRLVSFINQYALNLTS